MSMKSNSDDKERGLKNDVHDKGNNSLLLY